VEIPLPFADTSKQMIERLALLEAMKK